jgi:membrane fusion protein (multidrug efflux system)
MNRRNTDISPKPFQPARLALLARGGRSLFVAAALAVAALAPACRSAPPEARAGEVEAPSIEVKTVPAKTITVPRVLTLSGTLIGSEEAKVAAGAAGKVVSTGVERGSVVKKGAVLARLDARAASAIADEAAAQFESLKAQQAQAELDCERTQHMLGKGAISRADYDRARTQCETSKWSVSAAAARKTQTAEALRDMEIKAPFNGWVVERSVSPGEYVRVDSTVVTLVEVDQLRVELTVPEADLAAIRHGMTIDFRTTGDKSYRGRIRYIGPAVRQQTRDALIEAVVENGAHDLRPGMFVTARLELGEQSLPGIPDTAVRVDGTQRHVFVSVGGRLEDRLVQVGDARGGMVAVMAGLKPGEVVVADLSPDVHDGLKVK